MGWFWSFTLFLQTYKDVQQNENVLHQAACMNWSMPALDWKYVSNYLSCLCLKVDENVDVDHNIERNTIPDGISRHQPQDQQ